jgi:aconitate hydratase
MERGVPLAVIAGRNYGCGSSRDWAAKGVALLGVKTVIAESFERIHRTNLVGMGVLPLQFEEGTTVQSLGLDGTETMDIAGLSAQLGVNGRVTATIRRLDGTCTEVPLITRLDTEEDVAYWRHGGILACVWRDYLGSGDARHAPPAPQPAHTQTASAAQPG